MRSPVNFERSVPRKVMAHILPFTFFIFVISFLDRANISFAALSMRKDLDLSSEAFGFASGIFFLGYMLFEVPSNVALKKFGSRVWLARIQLTWGLVACATAFVQNATQLYVARFLLGVAEAGLIPGLIAYYNYWFRLKQLATAGALLGAATPVSFILSGPISTWIMEHVTVLQLSGWRAMTLLEGLPALLTGVLTYFVLTNRPADARWLTAPEREWLANELAAEGLNRPNLKQVGTLQLFRQPQVLMLGLVYILYQLGSFGVSFWMPQLIHKAGALLTPFQVGLVSTIPYMVATAGLYIWSWNSDRTGERRLHSIVALIVAGAGLAACALTQKLELSIALLSVAMTGFFAFRGPFNILPRLFLTRESAVVAFAVINTCGQIGAFSGPFLFGVIAGRTGGTLVGLLTLSTATLIAAALIAPMRFGAPAGTAKDADFDQTLSETSS
jgi:ACS family tartrate transporter-like MFS transporter